MLYSEFIKTDKVAAALKGAGVEHVPSFVKEDFSGPAEAFAEMSERIIDSEITNRRLTIESEQKIAEYKKKYAKELAIEEKAKSISPHVDALIKGKLKEPFDASESGCIAVVSEYCAKHFEFEPGETESKTEDYSGLSELQALLKKSSIMRLSHKMTIEEIALRGLHQSGISKFLK